MGIVNTIAVNGEQVKIGPTPAVVTFCGFKGPEEVRRVAAKNSQGEPYMNMDDLPGWFRNHQD